MSENQHETSPNFISDAASAAQRTYEEDLELFRNSYTEAEGRWDAVIDGNAHPAKFLEEHKVQAAWLEVKSILMPLYRQYQAAGSPQEWIREFREKQTTSEYYNARHERIRQWIEDYITYLERLHAPTEQMAVTSRQEVPEEQSDESVVKSLDPSVVEKIRAEMIPKLRGRYAAEPHPPRHRREDIESSPPPLRPRRGSDNSLTSE